MDEVDADGEEPDTEVGKKVAARGEDAYSSWRRLRPKAITGLVA